MKCARAVCRAGRQGLWRVRPTLLLVAGGWQCGQGPLGVYSRRDDAGRPQVILDLRCLSVCLWLDMRASTSAQATHPTALLTADYTCTERGELAQLPAVARRSLFLLTKCGQVGGGEEFFRSCFQTASTQ